MSFFPVGHTTKVTLPPTTMVNLKPFVYALLPAVTGQPTALRNLPAYSTASHLPASQYVTFAHVHQKRRDRRRQERARPKQAGDRITEEWLYSISSRTCRYKFRYVITSLQSYQNLTARLE